MRSRKTIRTRKRVLGTGESVLIAQMLNALVGDLRSFREEFSKKLEDMRLEIKDDIGGFRLETFRSIESLKVNDLKHLEDQVQELKRRVWILAVVGKVLSFVPGLIKKIIK